MYIFLDESGDLGFDFSKPGTSRYFNITLLVCDNNKVQQAFSKAVDRTRKNKLNRKAGKRPVRELKGTSVKQSIKEYFYRQLPNDGWRLYSVTLNKARVDFDLRTPAGKHRLYNFLTRFLISKVTLADDLDAVTLIVDRCKNSEQIKDFNRYMAQHLEARVPLNCQLHIDHLGSHESAGLQAVDLFCWGIVRKEDKGETDWYSVFHQKVCFHTVYLPPLD